MIEVVITKIPIKYASYFQYLILGFYELARKSEIKFKIYPAKLSDRIFLRLLGVIAVLKTIFKIRNFPTNEYCLEGFIIDREREIKFCYDIADTPYYYDIDKLISVDIYFKAQCPIDITEKGFKLGNDVVMPFHPDVLINKRKILPSMLGPGLMTHNIFSFRRLRKGYESILLYNDKKDGILMCYFGNSKGPRPVYSENPDLTNNENHLLAYYGNRISHPNEKRGLAAKLISSMGKSYDGRIINEGNSGTSDRPSNEHLIIPLKDYSAHIARFQYNLNISGKRLSIPYRFIFSFAVGTAIITDKLSVKWYKPFGKEVIETIEMGYLKNDEVNWNQFSESIKNLPKVTAEEIRKEFHEKWEPEAFARYIVSTCLNKAEE